MAFKRNERPRARKSGKRKKTEFHCCCCKQTFRFCWHCACGFEICQVCMEENHWGMTCNNITWVCPDCGEVRSFGNQ